MKKWFWFTVGLYLLVLLLLTVPVILFAGIKYSQDKHIWFPELSFADAVTVYREWGYWLWIAVFLACQIFLLLIPVAAAERRPVRRRHIGFLLGVTTFLLANLVVSAVSALSSGIFGDEYIDPIWAVAEKSSENPILVGILTSLHLPVPSPTFMTVLSVIGILFTCWGIWFLVFYRYAVATDPSTFLDRSIRWLIRGSILELLIAVPSHIIVRGRNDCCAPMATFWGMATGICVMLLAFGPAVFFLFVRRMKQLRPLSPPVTSDAIGSDQTSAQS